jgi:hypothetical protein
LPLMNRRERALRQVDERINRLIAGGPSHRQSPW